MDQSTQGAGMANVPEEFGRSLTTSKVTDHIKSVPGSR